MYGSREIAQKQDSAEAITNALISLRIISGSLTFVIFLIFTAVISRSYDEKMVFLGCSFYLIARSINIDWVFRGLEDFKYIALGNFATFIPMMFLLTLFISNQGNAAFAALIFSISYLTGGILQLFVLAWKYNIRYKASFIPRIWFHHLKESIHFTASNALINLYSYLPVIFLGFVASDVEVGLFSAPYKLITSIIYAITILPISMYPIYSDLFLNDYKKFVRLHNYYLSFSIITGLLIGICITLFRNQIISIIYGDNYIQSASELGIMAWFLCLTNIRVAYNVGIAAAGLQRFYSLVCAMGPLVYSIFFLILNASLADMLAASISLPLTEISIVAMLAILWFFKVEHKKVLIDL